VSDFLLFNYWFIQFWSLYVLMPIVLLFFVYLVIKQIKEWHIKISELEEKKGVVK
jgi:hypothetical protein